MHPDSRHYKRPPISEAVLELRLANPISTDFISKVSKKFNKIYFYEEQEQQVNVKVDQVVTKTVATVEVLGIRLASLDRTNLFLMRTGALIWSQLPPYGGWEDFSTRVMRDMEIVKKQIGPFPPLSRLGLRYTNRLDIPFTGVVLEEQEYLKVGPKLPDMALPPMENYAIQFTCPIGDDGTKFTLRSGPTASPLVDHMSLVLDIDVFREQSLPKKLDDLPLALDQFRAVKNHIFEASITDKARELFDR